MKLIKTLNLTNSVYSGKQKRFTELTLKPSPKTDDNGNPLGMNQRYYTLRFLSFEHGDRTDSPFIIRNEHVKYVMDANGKCTGVEKITCPTTEWAKNRLAKQGEPIGRGYCPICEYSFEKNKEAFAVKGQRDNTAARLASETQKKFAAYWPVYVVNDPHFKQNNQHLKVLRITDKDGFNKLVESIEYVMNEKGLNVFNGDEGVNFAILVEKVSKNLTDKNGNVVINKATGKPYVRTESKITDIKASTKNLVAYPQINDKAIEELDFDGTYNVASNHDALSRFLNSNWLMFGATEDAFESVESATTASTKHEDDGRETPTETATVVAANTASAAKATAVTETAHDSKTVEMFDGSADFSDKPTMSPDEMVMSVLGKSAETAAKSVAKPMQMPVNSDALREEVTNSPDFDDLPF